VMRDKWRMSMMVFPSVIRGVTVGCLVIVLAGCAAAVDAPEVGPSPPPAPTPSQSEPTSAPASVAGEGTVAMSPIRAAVDGGSREHARGATLEDDGELIAYTVAPDDIYEIVAERFDLPVTYLLNINAIRREGLELFAGDTLNLSAYRITSIGDQNGRVFDRQPPDPMPAQR
jgi:hypothetical protein